MKLKVQWTSGPSHQILANGKPCDRYSGTVYLTGATYGTGWMRLTMSIIGDTPTEVEDKLSQYICGQVVDIQENKIDQFIAAKGGKNANATR